MPSIEQHRARAHLEHLAWWPDERGLWVHDQLEFERFEALRWPVGGAPEAAFGSRDLPPPPAWSPSGRALALPAQKGVLQVLTSR